MQVDSSITPCDLSTQIESQGTNSQNLRIEPFNEPLAIQPCIGQKCGHCTLLSSLFDAILTEKTGYLYFGDFDTLVKVNTRIIMIYVGKGKFGVSQQQYKNVINEMLKDKLKIEQESKNGLTTTFNERNQNYSNNTANRRFGLIVNCIYSGNVTHFGVFERQFTLNAGIGGFEQLKAAHCHCEVLFNPLIDELRKLLALRQQNGLNVMYSFLGNFKSTRHRWCLTYLLRLVNESCGFPLFTSWVFRQIDNKCDLFCGIRDNNKVLPSVTVFYESLPLASGIISSKHYYLITSSCQQALHRSTTEAAVNTYEMDSLTVLPKSMVYYISSFLVYGDFDNFVTSSKEILDACIPSFDPSKMKTDNSNICNLKYTRRMARIQLDNLGNELTRFHSDNRYNNKISKIGSIIRNEFVMLYQDMKTVIPTLIEQFENERLPVYVTRRLNQLNDHLGNINHSSYACILQFIDLILYLISNRNSHGYIGCIAQILHGIGIKNDYTISLLTIIACYGKVELKEITFEKVNGIINEDDTDAFA